MHRFACLLLLLTAISSSGCRQQPLVSPEEGRQVAEAFLQALAENRPDDAWQSTSAEFKSDEGREAFRAYVRQHPVLAGPLAFVSHEELVINELPRSQFTFQPASGNAAPMVRIIVGQDFGEWKVDRVILE